MLKKYLTSIFLLLFLFIPDVVFANNENINCVDRYVTLINPVRNRQLWHDKSLKPIIDQSNLIQDKNFAATWLLQYDVFKDKELITLIKKLPSNQELGIFLEISSDLANDARVIYPPDTPWFSPKAIFLSGYSQSERRRLIDKSLGVFKQTFGYYPKSIGAWWIDSYSLQYMKNKYDIKSALIVADQKTTDNYGVWGAWWGVPFYPSKANILTPASNINNKLDIVITQWAQRDPLLAFENGRYSNYSLQANDYTQMDKDTKYFSDLIKVYLDCQNSIGQVTVGLETGMESILAFPEYQKQLEVLSTMPQVQFVTMSNFADKFRFKFPDYPKETMISGWGSSWLMNVDKRQNNIYQEIIYYNQNQAFSDYFLVDNNDFLKRTLPVNNFKISNQQILPIYLIIWCFAGIYFLLKKNLKLFLIASVFLFLSYGLLLKSKEEYGWIVFYGPEVSNLIIIQILAVLGVFVIFDVLSRFFLNNTLLFVIPLSYAINPILSTLRYSYIENKHYFGLMLDPLKFLGISFEKSLNISFINQDFPAYQAQALLKINFDKILGDIWLSLIVDPIFHLILGLFIGLILHRLDNKLRLLVLIMLIILTSIYFFEIWNFDPRVVVLNF